MAIQPLRKPTFHERVERKEARRKAKAAEATLRRYAKRQVSDEQRRLAYVRDGGKCRATGKWLPFKHSSIFKVAHSHHVVFLSIGGKDGPENRITVCYAIHRMIHHDRCLSITGDPNGTVEFTETNPETGKVVRVWTSTV